MLSISVDLETRSAVDLRRSGVYPYATHASTDVWCMAWAIDDGDVDIWFPGMVFPPELEEIMMSEEPHEFRAWNAQFERIIWRDLLCARYGFPPMRREDWVCTAAEAAAMSLPRALGNCANALKIPQQKGDRKLMLKMARPRSRKGRLTWWDDPELIKQLGEYCKGDVEAERALQEFVKPLIPVERELYLLDQKINDRGVLLDIELVHAASYISEVAIERANESIRDLTLGKIKKVTQTQKLVEWVNEFVPFDSIRRAAVRDLMDDPENVPEIVQKVLSLRIEAGKSSVSKLKSMKVAKNEDDRVRGMYMYHGATTGRWSGRGVQPQNLARPTIPDPERYIDDVRSREFDLLNIIRPTVHVVSSLLRGMFIPAPGCRFIVSDFAQVEARVLAWLAGQDDLVQAFKDGEPIYEPMAEDIYSAPPGTVTKDDPRRQMGKNSVLGCGFQMGADRFEQQVQEDTGVELGWCVVSGSDIWKGHMTGGTRTPKIFSSKAHAEAGLRTLRESNPLASRLPLNAIKFSQHVINIYRNKYVKIPQFWADINQAAFDAVMSPGTRIECGKFRFKFAGKFLYMILPSGRYISYAAPRRSLNKFDQDCIAVQSPKNWMPRDLYGGLLTENVVQATARDLLRDAMFRCEAAGLPVVMHSHDELVLEVPKGTSSAEEVNDIMSEVPTWAAGLPLAAETWEGERYRK